MSKIAITERIVTDIKIGDKVYCEIHLADFKGVATFESDDGEYFSVMECDLAGAYEDGDFFHKLTKLDKLLYGE